MNSDQISELYEIAAEWAEEKYSKKETGHTREYWLAYKFAALVAAAEREECAVECELLDMDYVTEDDWTIARETARVECAEAIRKRGEK